MLAQISHCNSGSEICGFDEPGFWFLSIHRRVSRDTQTYRLTRTHTTQDLWKKRKKKKGSRDKVGFFGTRHRCQLKVLAACLTKLQKLWQTFVSLLIWRPRHHWRAGLLEEKAGREDRAWLVETVAKPLTPTQLEQSRIRPSVFLANSSELALLLNCQSLTLLL